jgi:exopolysaccharide biosynthesis polyprenyl glycosylphosphotransferase
MLRDRQQIWRRLNLLSDIVLTNTALLTMILLFKPALGAFDIGSMFVITSLAWAIFLYTPSGSYFYRMKSTWQVLKELYWGLTKAFPIFVVAVFFAGIDVSPDMIVAFFASNALLLILSRIMLVAILNIYRLRGRSYRNAIIIGTGPKARKIINRIINNRTWGIQVIGFLDYNRTGLWRYRDIPLMGHPDGLADIINNNQVDYLIIATDSADLPLSGHAFAVAEEMGVTICLMSDIYFHPISRPVATNFMEFPAVIYSSVPDNRLQLSFKKVIDWIGGLVGVVISIPFTLAAAAAIKIEDGGPIFFRQTRAGRNGKPFRMLKFRTMVTNAEALKKQLMDQNEMNGPTFKMKKDPRITRIGAFLRKTSIDELPQFFNVLKGDMSLVGPRPPLPAEVAQYDCWQRRKLSVKPGITCLWQINGRNDIDFEDWMKLDLEYIDNWSLWLDTKILAKTVPAVFKREGAS